MAKKSPMGSHEQTLRIPVYSFVAAVNEFGFKTVSHSDRK